jgi:hypothetical protein
MLFLREGLRRRSKKTREEVHKRNVECGRSGTKKISGSL